MFLASGIFFISFFLDRVVFALGHLIKGRISVSLLVNDFDYDGLCAIYFVIFSSVNLSFVYMYYQKKKKNIILFEFA